QKNGQAGKDRDVINKAALALGLVRFAFFARRRARFWRRSRTLRLWARCVLRRLLARCVLTRRVRLHFGQRRGPLPLHGIRVVAAVDLCHRCVPSPANVVLLYAVLSHNASERAKTPPRGLARGG